MSSGGYIVTGGAGFIGANLVAELFAREPDCSVLVVDDMRTGSFANLVEACARKGVGPFAGELMADAVGDLNWQPAIEGLAPRAVFHLAANTDTTVVDEAKMIRDNTECFADMLSAAAEARVPLVYASSAAVYGTPAAAARRGAFALDAAGAPSNVYGFSKWLMEAEHRRFAASCVAEGAPEPWIVGLRYFNVFGPGESRKGHMASMCYQLATRALSGRSPRLFEPGDQERDQVFIDDVVDATLGAAGLGERPDPAPGVYNIGSGRATSFNEVVSAIGRGLGEPGLAPEYFAMPPEVRAFYQDFTLADLSETARGLGWTPGRDPIAAMEGYAASLAARSAAAARGATA